MMEHLSIYQKVILLLVTVLINSNLRKAKHTMITSCLREKCRDKSCLCRVTFRCADLTGVTLFAWLSQSATTWRSACLIINKLICATSARMQLLFVRVVSTGLLSPFERLRSCNATSFCEDDLICHRQNSCYEVIMWKSGSVYLDLITTTESGVCLDPKSLIRGISALAFMTRFP